MTKKLMGLFASVALMGSGMALADDQTQQDTQSQSQGTTEGSGSMGSGPSGSMQGGSQDIGGAGQSGQVQSGQAGMTSPLGGNQIMGRVVKSQRKMVWVEYAGAIVPLKIDKKTQFTDPTLTRAQDIKEGDRIRASFEVRETDNVATSIEKSEPGMGGSGLDVMPSDQSINPPVETLPPTQGGTGGSGTGDDQRPPDTGSDINPDDTRSDY